ncbi:Sodium-coupled monocarboxylate transporter 1 [Chamberlinius hualienensis]
MLRVEDYVIIIAMMVISTAAGLYFSMVKGKQSSTMEYFLASRNMGVSSMALSFFATAIATGTMIGFPVETYFFGLQVLMFCLSIPFVIWFNNQLVIPIFYSLKTASIFKYFEIRFNRGLACAVAGTNIIQMTCHSSVSLYGVAIALEEATGIDWFKLSCGLAAICIFYSTMGGIRGIIITDAVQAIIILASVIILIIMGIISSGGLERVWNINHATDRTDAFNFDVDPRTRHTFWNATIGYAFILIASTSTTQSFVQRLLVAPDIKKAQQASTIGLLVTSLQLLLCGLLGLVIFAYYQGCNVVKIGLIKTPNQLLSLFAMAIFSTYRCLNGIYFGALICASLSTVSSSLNSISAVVIETFIKPCKPLMSDKTTTFVCKIIVLAAGIVTFVGTILISQFQNVLQAGIAMMSVIMGPLLALYLIGICFPQASTKLATVSFFFAVLFSLWIVVGSLVWKPVSTPKTFLNECDGIVHPNEMTNQSLDQRNWTYPILPFNSTETLYSLNSTVTATNVSSSTTNLFPLSSMSYNWYTVIGVITAFICFGSLASIFSSKGYCMPSDLSRADLVPDVIKKLHLKLSPKMRRIFLCDIYK